MKEIFERSEESGRNNRELSVYICDEMYYNYKIKRGDIP